MWLQLLSWIWLHTQCVMQKEILFFFFFWKWFKYKETQYHLVRFNILLLYYIFIIDLVQLHALCEQSFVAQTMRLVALDIHYSSAEMHSYFLLSYHITVGLLEAGNEKKEKTIDSCICISCFINQSDAQFVYKIT